MKIHEYQAKQLLREAGVTVPRGMVVDTPQGAADAFRQLGGKLAVVKAQIHAGGRGKGTIQDIPEQRGVQVVHSADDAHQAACNLLGHTLVTVQTGGRTHRSPVARREGLNIARELYLGIVVDRAAAKPVLMASAAGGMDIETVAAENPSDSPRDVRPRLRLVELSGPKTGVASGVDQWVGACRGEVHAAAGPGVRGTGLQPGRNQPAGVDGRRRSGGSRCKIDFDDNALMRHPEVLSLRDLAEENPAETRAAEEGLSYVKLDGNIGCLVSGAGLAMSTMDLIKLHGGEPANFLDVGGGANVHQVTEAFRILLADRNVEAVLVNIFGGIMRCTTIAKAILAAYKTVGFDVPLVVRLEGTEVEEGRQILAESGVDIVGAEGLTDAAKKVVAAAVGRGA